MQRHPFDPLSAALGVLAVAIGTLVAAARIDELDGGSGAWIAAGALLVGLGLVPWSRHRARHVPTPADDPAATIHQARATSHPDG